ncbi:MAG: glycoside hydrolase family 3 C-terminal domain-containing protein [Bacilli bacterium]|jgi:beta-glucosidase|nr:glycoside hydrolase family 3 C-terminal domain-containing protein [Bacilli bacterium]
MEKQKTKKRNPFQVIFSHVHSRIWFIVSAVLVILLIVVSVLATSEQFSSLIDMVAGGERAILDANYKPHFENDKGLDTKSAALKNGNDTNVELCEEGMVLLKNKNNALPIAKGSKVSVFGKNSVNIALSGSGSAGSDVAGAKSLYDSLTDAGFTTNPTLKDFYNDKASGSGRTSNPAMDSGVSTLDVGETPIASYTDKIRNSYDSYSDAAIIVLTRVGGEGFDLPRAQIGDTSKTFLDMDPNETALISSITDSGMFKKVVVLINAANQLNCSALEDNDKIDAVLWMGFPGGQGAMAVGEILNGTVNPSGHLTDTYVRDFKSNPSYNNFGDNGTTDGNRFTSGGKNKLYYFTDYEEGIYVGYRYYETRGETDGDTWYNSNVVYPFGYGLSYTNFTWSQATATATTITKGQTFDVNVTVTNSGSVAGKDVVEIYAAAPYTAGGIEKSARVLVGFEKTGIIEPGKSEDVTVTVDPYDFASYDATDANANGFKGYELDAGSYTIYAAHTAHDKTNSIALTSANIQWDTDPVTGNKVENRFEDVGSHLQTILSRSNWDGTWPASPTATDRELTADMLTALKDTTTTDNPLASTYTTMPKTGVSGDVNFFDMFGLDYNDAKWDTLLDEVTADEELDMLRNAGFNTAAIASIGKPKTTDSDGPVGLTVFMGDPTVYSTTKYCCEPISGATWNKELIEKMGQAVGNEGLVGNVKGDGRPYTGWYAPAMNLHRSPFCGRCCEYFSEDPYLSGMMAAYEVKGANSKGMTTYLKHFVGNEQETNRDSNGVCSFMTEQALRELYLKPFEKAVKVGKSRGVMTSFNRIGTRWVGCTYNLCTAVLRNEWGFHGAVITDFDTHHNTYMKPHAILYAGGTLDLVSQPAAGSDFADVTSAADMTILRNATHETLYAMANSNVKKVVGYKMAKWRVALLIVDIALPVGLIVWGFFAIRQSYKKEKNPATVKPAEKTAETKAQ